MFYHAKNGNVRIGDIDMDYVSFGKGVNVLIMIPGLGDGLSTVKGKAFILANLYKKYAKNYKVYIFSRKKALTEGYSIRDMAKDQAEAMKILGLSKVNVLGISQGGMIAQYLAIDYPDLVKKLVLAVTLSKQNETFQKVINEWIEIAKKKNYKELIINTAEKSYSEQYLKKYRFLYPLLGRIGKPKNFDRFIIQATSCIRHNTYDELSKIVCPTFIIGGECDKIISVDSSFELNEKITDSELFIYKGLGHATYEEAKDFNSRVINFLSK